MAQLLREAIGGTIRRARTERARTLRDVSRDARVSLGYLSEIERGRKEPSSELLAAICEALALPLPDLLDDVADSLRPRAAAVPARLGPVPPRLVGVVDPALRSAVEAAFTAEPAAAEEAGVVTADAAAPVEERAVEGPVVAEPVAAPEDHPAAEAPAVTDEPGDEQAAPPLEAAGTGDPGSAPDGAVEAAAGELRLVEMVTLARPGLVRSAA